ncbi:MAG: GAF domain-containing protein [Chitinispirillaceae bacterium]|nr:GAF domain-containing protein [Chitinispirillaceae bacterium]
MAFKVKESIIPAEVVDIWQQLVDIVAQLLGSPIVMINRLHPPELEVFRTNPGATNPFSSGLRMPMEGIYCTAAATARQRLEVTDARKDAQWAQSPTAKAGIFAYLGYPLFWPDGDVFGTICTVDTKENDWGERGDDILSTFKNAIEVNLALVNSLEQLQRKNSELDRVMGETETLRWFLPICSSCKKIRDEKGYWNRIETYFAKHSSIKFSHGICPECAKSMYEDFHRYQNETRKTLNGV